MMNVDDRLLLSRLDGFLDALSYFNSANKRFMFGAFLIENISRDSSIEESLKRHYSEMNAGVTQMDEVDNWVGWLETELAQILNIGAEKLSSALLWQQMEMLRMLTDDFSGAPLKKYRVELESFEGTCYTILSEGSCIVLQFFEKKNSGSS